MIFLLNDPTLISINHIQQAHKQADNGYNDLVAQLYKKEFESSQEANKERRNNARNKAIELQRIETENRKAAEKEAERLRVEKARIDDENKRLAEEQARRDKAVNESEVDNAGTSGGEITSTNQSLGGSIGSSWSEVSPEQASQYMANHTPIGVQKWLDIIYHESTNNPFVVNNIGCFGYLQLHPVHGNVSGMTPEQYLQTAVSVYNSQGLSAWEVTTNGMVN